MSQKITTTIRQTQVVGQVVDEQVVTTNEPVTQTVESAQRSRVTEIVYAGSKGATGPAGPAGPPGSPGAPGSAPQSYVHVQNTPSDTWTIHHNLGYYPNIEIYDSANTHCETDVTHVDANTAVSHAEASFGGTAYCS